MEHTLRYISYSSLHTMYSHKLEKTISTTPRGLKSIYQPGQVSAFISTIRAKRLFQLWLGLRKSKALYWKSKVHYLLRKKTGNNITISHVVAAAAGRALRDEPQWVGKIQFGNVKP